MASWLIQIADSLHSSKVRQRTESLAKLEDAQFQTLIRQRVLDRDTVLQLLEGLCKFISLDVDVYLKAPSNAQAEMRLLKASHLVRKLCSVVFQAADLVASFKQKHYEMVVDYLTSNLVVSDRAGYDEPVLILPVVANCVRALNVMVQTQDVKDHLPVSKYQSILSHVLECLHLVTNMDSGTARANECLGELLLCFLEFLGPAHTATLTAFSNANTSAAIDNYYLQITQVVLDYCRTLHNNSMRESETVIAVFRIINRCIADLQTLDVKLCHRLCRTGVCLVQHLKSITFPRLLLEVAVFCNLVADFWYLPDFPRLKGDNWNIDSSGNLVDPESHNLDESQVIASASDSSMMSLSSSFGPSNPAFKQLADFLAQITDLLQAQEDQLALAESTVEITVFASKSLFELADLQLRREGNVTGWLMRQGLARCLAVYFEFKKDSIADSDIHRVKRRKLSSLLDRSFTDLLAISDNVLELFLSLIQRDTVRGIQLLTICCSYWKSHSHLRLCAAGLALIQSHSNRILSTLVSHLDCHNTSLKYWDLLCCVVLLRLQSELSASLFAVLFKCSLEFAKDPALCRPACMLFCALCDIEPSLQPSKQTLQPFETMLSLAEINGPALVCRESVLFWRAAFKLCQKHRFHGVRLRRELAWSADDDGQLFSHRATHWLLSKWTQLDTTVKSVADVSAAVTLVLWLIGNSSELAEITDDGAVYQPEHSVCFDYKEKAQLREYVLLQRQQKAGSTTPASVVFDFPALACKPETCVELVRKFRDFLKEVKGPAECSWWAFCVCESRFTDVCQTPPWRKARYSDRQEKAAILASAVDSLSKAVAASNVGRSLCEYLTEKQVYVDLCRELKQLQGDAVASRRMDMQFTDEFSGEETAEQPADSTDVYNYRNLVAGESTLEMKMVRICMHLFADVNTALDEAASLIHNEASEMKKMACYFELDCQLRLTDEADETVLDNLLTDVMNLLTEHRAKTYELCIVVLCRLIGRFSAVWLQSQNADLKGDCLEVHEYMRGLYEKGMLYTQRELVEFCRFTCRMAENGCAETATVLPRCFAECDNYSKMAVSSSLAALIAGSSTDEQFELYDKLVTAFATPQKSVESSATFNCLLSVLSTASDGLTLATLCHLLEFSQFDQVKAYLAYSLEDVMRLNGVQDHSLFFWNYKELIFKWWREFELPLAKFPVQIFDCANYADFVFRFYKELTGIFLAYNDRKAVQEVAKVTGLPEKAVVQDSLSVAVALSWTKYGIHEKLFDLLPSYLGSRATKSFLKEQLPLVVYQILRFLRCAQSEVQVPSTPDTLGEFGLSITEEAGLKQIDELTRLCKYGPFWTVSNVYFVVSRLLFALEKATSDSDRCNWLDRVQLVMKINPEAAADEHVSALVAQTAAKYICNDLTEERALKVIETTLQNCAGSDQFAAMCLPVVEQLLEVGGEKVEQFAAQLLSSLTGSDSLLQLVKAGLQSVLDRPVTMSTETGLSILDGKTAKLASMVLPLTADWRDKKVMDSYVRGHLVQKLYEIARTPCAHTLSSEFKVWMGQCIGQYYSRTGKTPVMEQHEFDQEPFEWYKGPDFADRATKLDFLLARMQSSSEKSDLGGRLGYEVIVSAILFKKTGFQGLQDLLSFADRFDQYEEYLCPMDTYMCSLCGAELETCRPQTLYSKESFQDVLKGFSHYIEQTAFSEWLLRVYLGMIHDLTSTTSLMALMAAYCGRDEQFVRSSFTSLTLFFIQNAGPASRSRVSSMINAFFSASGLCKEAVETFVELVLMIRVGSKSLEPKCSEIMSQLDKPAIYSAALTVKKPQTALMLMEDWLCVENSLTPGWENTHYQSFQQAYTLLDEKDLFFGLPAYPTLDCGISYVRHGEAQNGALTLASGELEVAIAGAGHQSITSASHQVSRDMLEMGWTGLSSVVEGVMEGDAESGVTKEASYERAWKLSRWDLPEEEGAGGAFGEHAAMYETLRKVAEKVADRGQACEGVVCKMVDQVCSSVSVSAFCRVLAFAVNVGEIVGLDEDSLKAYLEDGENVLTWMQDSEQKASEDIILGRRAAYDICSSSSRGKMAEMLALGSVLEMHRYGTLMREKLEKTKSVGAAIRESRAVEKWKDGLEEASSVLDCAQQVATFDLAAAFWVQGEETSFPVQTLKVMIDESKESDLLSRGLLRAYMAQWCIDSRQETPETIIKEYVEKEEGQDHSRMTAFQHKQMCRMFAEFCDGQLRDTGIDEKMGHLVESTKRLNKDLQQLQTYIDTTRAKRHERRKKRRTDKKTAAEMEEDEEYRAAIHSSTRLNVQFDTERAELNVLNKNRQNYIAKALTYYLKASVNDSSAESSEIDRFCELWLEHNDADVDKSLLDSAPAHQFVPWVNQLTSKLLKDDTRFQKLLWRLVLRIARTHPYHTLYLLKSLRLTRAESKDAAAQSRGEAAENLWRMLERASLNVSGSSSVVRAVDEVCDQSVRICQLPHNNLKKMVLAKVGGSWWHSVLPSLRLPSPVAKVPVQVARPYVIDKMSVITTVDPILTTSSSGISRPKIMKLRMSDGSSQRMILKGGTDDLRQDAIMEQVFEKVNLLLFQDDSSRRRRLRMRIYKVVSLGPGTGMIDFVAHSIALYDILAKLHSRDRISVDEGRKMMNAAQKKSRRDRLQTYREIVNGVPPAFRRFFFDNFESPADWWESRQAYTRGVAVSSMVGYVLGLGDRHCNNILVDTRNGEPVHIDLGVAFDQGKALAIPETVPFRLTRDMVDGFGVAGTEGLFARACQETLRVLRAHTEYVCGILDVLKYDPLYTWTLSPLRKQQLQQTAPHYDKTVPTRAQAHSVSDEAQIAIDVVKKKLVANGLSDEAVVRVLVRNATSPENLAMIFMGWSPFL